MTCHQSQKQRKREHRIRGRHTNLLVEGSRGVPNHTVDHISGEDTKGGIGDKFVDGRKHALLERDRSTTAGIAPTPGRVLGLARGVLGGVRSAIVCQQSLSMRRGEG